MNGIISLWNVVPSMVIGKIHFYSVVHTVGMKKVKSKALFLTFDQLKIFEDMTLIILYTNKFFRSSIVSIALFSTSGGELLKKTADTNTSTIWHVSSSLSRNVFATVKWGNIQFFPMEIVNIYWIFICCTCSWPNLT